MGPGGKRGGEQRDRGGIEEDNAATGEATLDATAGVGVGEEVFEVFWATEAGVTRGDWTLEGRLLREAGLCCCCWKDSVEGEFRAVVTCCCCCCGDAEKKALPGCCGNERGQTAPPYGDDG